jgi:hypothetical protein
MGFPMAAVTHSEPTAAPVAEPERRSAPARSARDTVLWMQRNAGNAAVARAVARPARRSIQRCGAGCGCSTCSTGPGQEELLEEQFGLLRTAVARRTA